MLEIALSLFDYLIKLVEKREGNIDEYFAVYVKPAFEISEKVFSDYLSLLHAVKRKIQLGSRKREIIEFLEDGRVKYLPLRRQIYAEANSRWKWNQRDSFDKLPKFEKGLLGILMGGLSPFEAGEIDEHRRYAYSTPYTGGHTLLDVLISIEDMSHLSEAYKTGLLTKERYEKLKNRKYDEEITESNKSRYNFILDEQIAALEAAWQDVVEGYSEYKSLVAIKPTQVKKLQSNVSITKAHKYKREGD